MRLENIKGKMNRNEMRNIMAGSGSGCAANYNDGCTHRKACVYGSSAGICKTVSGVCTCQPV